MSLCMEAYKALQPKSYSEMKEIFEQFKVKAEEQENEEVIKDPNLVVQIEKNFYNWETGVPVLMELISQTKNLEEASGRNALSLDLIDDKNTASDPVLDDWFHNQEYKKKQLKDSKSQELCNF